ncbi:GNAT family N-acetyltransferase [Amycolatopsis sp. WQ 127309]|uniref:GNAT family N-acetyltransferase n=1 Tax=Amycolatopsis sp. WQ 127309 TaxID=2932773 RepID=UPI001FF4F677|nr:GNAT family N-acetyltransferase [Amycolatopsis sp. WQ 127309]UOZ11314.1 GNAT family N-acetyltransferase [Amycolatopsis sp. WQ 127309]
MTQETKTPAPLTVLATARTTLCEVPFDEVRAILAGESGAGKWAWAPGYPFDGTLGGAKLVLRMVTADAYRPGFGLYQIVDGESGLAIGDVGFHAAPDAAGEAEIGYGLIEAFRGRGLATEVVEALLTWTFEQPGVTAVLAETDEDHLPSRRVLEKNGFAFLGSDGETRNYAKRREPGS